MQNSQSDPLAIWVSPTSLSGLILYHNGAVHTLHVTPSTHIVPRSLLYRDGNRTFTYEFLMEVYAYHTISLAAPGWVEAYFRREVIDLDAFLSTRARDGNYTGGRLREPLETITGVDVISYPTIEPTWTSNWTTLDRVDISTGEVLGVLITDYGQRQIQRRGGEQGFRVIYGTPSMSRQSVDKGAFQWLV